MSHDDIERALRGAGPREAGESPRPMPPSLAEASRDLRAVERRRLVARTLSMTVGVLAAGAVVVTAVALTAVFLRLPALQVGGGPSADPSVSSYGSTPVASPESSAICAFFAEGGPESMITTPESKPAFGFPVTPSAGSPEAAAEAMVDAIAERVDAINQFADLVSGDERDDVLALAAAIDELWGRVDEYTAYQVENVTTDYLSFTDWVDPTILASYQEHGPEAFYVEYGPPCGQPLPVVDCGGFDQATCDATWPDVVAGWLESPYAPPIPMPVTRVNLEGPSACGSSEVRWIYPYGGIAINDFCDGPPVPTPAAIVGSPEVGVPYEVALHDCMFDFSLGDTWWRFENGPTPEPIIPDTVGTVHAVVTLTSPDTAILRTPDGTEVMLIRVDEPIEGRCY